MIVSYLTTANGTDALGINDKGHVVAYYFDSSSHANGFLYSGGKYTTLDDPLVDGTFATGINNKGQIVGYYYDNLNNQHGFLYSGGKYTTLDDPLGVDGTFVTGINDKGQVVGYYLDPSSGSQDFLATGDALALPRPIEQQEANVAGDPYHIAARDSFVWAGIDRADRCGGGF